MRWKQNRYAERASDEKNMLPSSSMNLETKKKLVEGYVWRTLLCGSETSIMGRKDGLNRIEAFDTLVYKKWRE